MKPLKEALISKDKRKWATISGEEYWVVLVPSEEEEYKIQKAGWEGDRFLTKDCVTCYPIPKKSPIWKKLDLNDFDELVVSVTKKKMKYDDVVDIITNSEYYENGQLWDKNFEDMDSPDVLEALISNDKRNWASGTGKYVMIFPFDSESFFANNYSKNRVPLDHGYWTGFLFKFEDFKKILKNPEYFMSLNVAGRTKYDDEIFILDTNYDYKNTMNLCKKYGKFGGTETDFSIPGANITITKATSKLNKYFK